MKFRSIVTALFSILMVCLVVWFIQSNLDALKEIQISSPWLIGVLGVLLAARMTLRGFFHWHVLRSLDVKISIKESLALNFAGTMMNQLLPMPVGPGYRAAYLKKHFDFPYSLFASTLAALFIYWMLVSTTLGLVAAIWYGFSKNIVDWWIMGVLSVSVLSSLSFFFIPKRFLMSQSGQSGWLAKRLRRGISGWQTIISSRPLIVAASLVVVLTTSISAAAMYIGFKTIGIEMETPGVFLLMSSQRIGSLIKLTPGAIGYQEMVGMYFSSILKPTAAQAAVVFGMTRILNVVTSVVAGLPSFWMLSNRAALAGKSGRMASEAGE
ncbi:MAG: lysylphosphatidylglycerol synthase transmembrane domain-containing protein [Planctomycetota bacterium]